MIGLVLLLALAVPSALLFEGWTHLRRAPRIWTGLLFAWPALMLMLPILLGLVILATARAVRR
jgi:hypothetical protein